MYSLYIEDNFENLSLIYLLVFIVIFIFCILLIRAKIRTLKGTSKEFKISSDILFKITVSVFFWPITIGVLMTRGIALLFVKLQHWLIAWINGEM